MALTRLTWDEAALIIVDMQNDFVRSGAPLEVPEARATIPVIQSLAEAFRSRSRPVIYTRFIAGPQRTLIWEWGQDDCHAPPTCCCWRGVDRHYPDINARRWCAAVVDELTPAPPDYVVDKYGYDAFHNTQLPDILRAEGCRGFVITGTVTQICVDSTVRGGLHRGFLPLVATDAVSSYRADLHAAALDLTQMKFGIVATAAELSARLAAA